MAKKQVKKRCSQREHEITIAIRRHRDLKPGRQTKYTGIDRLIRRDEQFYLIEEPTPRDVGSEKRFTLRQVIGWLETVPDDELERMTTFEYVFAFTSDGFAIDDSFIRIGGEDIDIGGCQTGYRMKPIALGQTNPTNN